MRIYFSVVPSSLEQTSGAISVGKIIVQCCQEWKRSSHRRIGQALASVSCPLLLHVTGSYGSCNFSVSWIFGLEYSVERLFNTSLLCLLKEPHIVVVLHLTLAKLGCQPKYLSVKKTQEGNYAISEIHRVMHTCLNSSTCRKVVECAVRLEKHFKISSRPGSAHYFHSWLGWWNRRWTAEIVRWLHIRRACKIIFWSRGEAFKVILISCYKDLKINRVKFSESKCNVPHTKSITKL